MGALRGLAFGTLGLALLEATVSDPKAAKRVGAVGTLGAKLLDRLVNPSVPLIPEIPIAKAPLSSTSSTNDKPVPLAL